jgi:hypothetical protein
MEFSEYLAEVPRLHSWDHGRTWVTGGFEATHLSQIAAAIRSRFARPRVIETGAGNSTLTFLFTSPARVLSICPEEQLFQRIIQYCEDKGMDHSALETRTTFSQFALPEIFRTGETFDFALVDGAHGWPLVMVDFCYMNAMLRKGALLMIDDVQLHSIAELMRLLDEQPGFTRACDLGKSVIYAKLTDDPFLPEWVGQPYIVRRSNEAQPPTLKQAVLRALRRVGRR